jgi:hypothetical protein
MSVSTRPEDDVVDRHALASQECPQGLCHASIARTHGGKPYRDTRILTSELQTIRPSECFETKVG